jgi:hypothetical protein
MGDAIVSSFGDPARINLPPRMGILNFAKNMPTLGDQERGLQNLQNSQEILQKCVGLGAETGQKSSALS